MNPVLFQRRYEASWDRLDALLQRRRGVRTSDIPELIRMYRELTSHLSYAQTYFPEHDVTRRLNALAARANLAIYGKRSGEWSDVWRFISGGFPKALRKAAPFFLTAWFMMLAGAVIGFVTVQLFPGAIYALLPSQFIQGFHPSQTGPHAVDAPVMSSLIMTNNIRVAIFAFLGAFTLGIYTCVILYQNGLILGALAAVFLQAHRSLIFWSLILPHGCIELTAIAVSGASGLMIAYRLIVPGQRTRLFALRHAAVEGGKLLFGAALLLMVAGTIEGFFTPSVAPIPVKYGLAGTTVFLLVLYFGFAGRSRRRGLTASSVRTIT